MRGLHTTDVIQIGRFSLEPHRQLLASGRPVPLGGKALELLSVLAEAEGDLVTKDELMSAVWPGVVVEENAIQVHISAARKALAEEAARLVTVRGKGYRLERDPAAPNVHPRSATAAAVGARRFAKWAWTLLLVPVLLIVALVGREGWRAAGETPTVAVLPFVEGSLDPRLGYLSDGIAAEIQSSLMKSPSPLRVVGVGSSFQLRTAAERTPGNVRRRLGATHVLTGSLQVMDQRLRVIAELIDTRNGELLWSETYDRQLGDLLDVQSSIARRVAGALHAAAPNLARGAQSIPPAALQNYLQAMQIFREGVTASRSVDDAAILLEAATREAPGFAGAWARLAEAYRLQSRYQDEGVQEITILRARAAARRALDLNPRDGFAHAVLGGTLPEWNWGERLEQLRLAEQQSPNDVDVVRYRSELMRRMGRLHEVRAAIYRMAQLDPLSPEAQQRAWSARLQENGRVAAERDLRHLVAQTSTAAFLWTGLLNEAVQAHDLPAAERALKEIEAAWPTIRARFRWSDQQAAGFLQGYRKDVAALRSGRPTDPGRAESHFASLQTTLRGQGCAADSLADLADARAGRPTLAWQVAEELYLRRGYVGSTETCGRAVYLDRQTATWPLFVPETATLRADVRIWRIFAAVGLAKHWLAHGDWPDFCRQPGLGYDCAKAAAAALHR